MVWWCDVCLMVGLVCLCVWYGGVVWCCCMCVVWFVCEVGVCVRCVYVVCVCGMCVCVFCLCVCVFCVCMLGVCV